VKIEFIDNWKQGYKFFGTIAGAIAWSILLFLLSAPQYAIEAINFLPPEYRIHIGEDIYKWLAFAAVTANIFLRFVKQPSLHKETETSVGQEGESSVSETNLLDR